MNKAHERMNNVTASSKQTNNWGLKKGRTEKKGRGNTDYTKGSMEFQI